MKNIMMKTASLVASLAFVITAASANSICMMWMHQPELPEGAAELRRR